MSNEQDVNPERQCYCMSAGPSLTRRQALLGVTALGAGAFTLLSAPARGEMLLAPCIQTTQKPQPCRHKFCRYYAGEGDYYGR